MIERLGGAERRLPEVPPPLDECVLITSYDEAVEVLRRPADFRARNARGEESIEFFDGTLLSLDGHEHMKLRRILARLMSPSVLDGYREFVVRTFRENLRSIRLSAHHQSAPLDLLVLLHNVLWLLGARITGIDVEARHVEQLAATVSPAAEGRSVRFTKKDHTEVLSRARKAVADFEEEFYLPSRQRREGLLGQHAVGNSDVSDLPVDMLTLLLASRPEVSDGAILRNCIATLTGSVGNTAATICHSLNELAAWCEGDWGRPELRDDAMIARIVNEAIRLHRTGDPYIIRLTRHDSDVQLGSSGRRIAKGCPVGLDVRKINRDREYFGDNVSYFDPNRRTSSSHVKGYGLGFGMGEHTCLAKRLIVNDATEPDHYGLATAVVRELISAGIRPDPDHPAVAELHAHDRFASFHVILDKPTDR